MAGPIFVFVEDLFLLFFFCFFFVLFAFYPPKMSGKFKFSSLSIKKEDCIQDGNEPTMTFFISSNFLA